MREIKFRGKVFNIWVYGHYLPWHSVQDENGKDVYAQIFIDDGRHSVQNIVGAHTISEYTGLTDKNGKEIYEGDIVKRSNPPTKDEALYVFYNQSHACYALKSNYGCTYEPISNFGAIEVVGNIFDNPELLEGDKQ